MQSALLLAMLGLLLAMLELQGLGLFSDRIKCMYKYYSKTLKLTRRVADKGYKFAES
jgi:hypothetical protein